MLKRCSVPSGESKRSSSKTKKKVLAGTKKAAGNSKINNVRKALAELTAAKAPRDFVCEAIMTYAEKLVKK